MAMPTLIHKRQHQETRGLMLFLRIKTQMLEMMKSFFISMANMMDK